MWSASNPTRIEIAADAEALAERYAGWFAGVVAAAEAPVRIALCGGRSPQPLFRLLASERWCKGIDWAKLEIFWSDERFVAHEDTESNVHLARMLLLDHVPLTSAQIHPMPTDGDLGECASRYETLLKTEYGSDLLDPARPLFDVMLLGIGENGHTASLMPGDPALEDRARWVAAVRHGVPQERLTLTYPAIASSRFVTFLVTGEDKSRIVAQVRADDRSLPAARVTSLGELIWFLDTAAAGGVEKSNL